MALASPVGLFKDMLGTAFFHPASQLREGYLLLPGSPLLQLCPDYLQKGDSCKVSIDFIFLLEEAQKSLLLLSESERCSVLSSASDRNKEQQRLKTRCGLESIRR